MLKGWELWQHTFSWGARVRCRAPRWSSSGLRGLLAAAYSKLFPMVALGMLWRTSCSHGRGSTGAQGTLVRRPQILFTSVTDKQSVKVWMKLMNWCSNSFQCQWLYYYTNIPVNVPKGSFKLNDFAYSIMSLVQLYEPEWHYCKCNNLISWLWWHLQCCTNHIFKEKGGMHVFIINAVLCQNKSWYCC